LAVGEDERVPDEPDDRRPGRRRRDESDDRPDYERPHRGGMILAFGIISLVFFQCLVGFVFGILAWVMGNSDLKGMADGEVDPEGKQLTQVGRILGIVGLGISVLYMLFLVAYLIFMFAFIAAMPKGPPPAAPVPIPAPAPAPPPIKGARAILVPTQSVGTR
jgi:hypothetical protein